jgi:uncharacterized HhH-GPD family protein
MARPALWLTPDDAANRLLSTDPLALLIGMVLDQQIPLERAFSAPAELAERLGRPLDAADLAGMDPEALAAVFAERPALHRYPGSMAARVQALCQLVVAEYGGDAASIWSTAGTGRELLRRVKALPGFGDQKARIFVALLGKQLGVRPEGWEEASAPFGEPGSFRSVADIVDPASLEQVRAIKQAHKAAAKAAQAASAPGPSASSARAGRAKKSSPTTTSGRAPTAPRSARTPRTEPGSAATAGKGRGRSA